MTKTNNKDKILSPVKERILYFLENQKESKQNFFSKTGISPSNFKGIGAKSELGTDKIVKILSIYQNLNPEWLLTGEGEMLRENVGGPPPPRRPPEVPAQELEALRREVQLLRKLVDTLEATVAAKDIIIGQLQRALDRLERER